jgi:hypothetical protein
LTSITVGQCHITILQKRTDGNEQDACGDNPIKVCRNEGFCPLHIGCELASNESDENAATNMLTEYFTRPGGPLLFSIASPAGA